MVQSDYPSGPFSLVVAHRGASADQPENTLPSFEAAISAGADVVELDVRLSADGVAVVMHDPEVSRATDGHGFVHEMTLEELKGLDASRGRGPRAEVATLREVLEAVSGRAGVDLEIKNIPGEPAFDSPTESVLQAALGELDAASFVGEVLISSFNMITIERSLALAPDIPTGFLTIGAIEPSAALVYARGSGHAWVLPNVEALLRAGEAFVREAHESGVRVGTWTVDEPSTMATLFGWGVDAVASNDPRLAVSVRDGAAGSRS
ncbi:MAG: glycerophosphodiester phosphodiesterase [Actinomycetota bacterium]|nr:glycerophosphodiester phosphodiesterase [Actinomycetota bacterium]